MRTPARRSIRLASTTRPEPHRSSRRNDDPATAAAEVCASGPPLLAVIIAALAFAALCYLRMSRNASRLAKHPWFVKMDAERAAAARARSLNVMLPPAAAGAGAPHPSEALYRYVPGVGFVAASVAVPVQQQQQPVVAPPQASAPPAAAAVIDDGDDDDFLARAFNSVRSALRSAAQRRAAFAPSWFRGGRAYAAVPSSDAPPAVAVAQGPGQFVQAQQQQQQQQQQQVAAPGSAAAYAAAYGQPPQQLYPAFFSMAPLPPHEQAGVGSYPTV